MTVMKQRGAGDDSQVMAKILSHLERAAPKRYPLELPLGARSPPVQPSPLDAAWRRYLEAHPEAWDSLRVLGNLATAIAAYEYPGVATWSRGFSMALLQRAAPIVQRTLGRWPRCHGIARKTALCCAVCVACRSCRARQAGAQQPTIEYVEFQPPDASRLPARRAASTFDVFSHGSDRR